MRAYRRYHLMHHRHTQTDLDPDLALSLPFPTTRASLVRKFWRDLTGQTGVKLLVGRVVRAFQLAGDEEAIEAAESASRPRNLADTADWRSFAEAAVATVGVVVLFGVVGQAANGGWWWGLAFWLLPLLTWFQLVLRIRNIAEHAATERSDDPLRNTRTTLAGPLARLFVAPYHVNYHLEHHVAMYVPCWRLAGAARGPARRRAGRAHARRAQLRRRASQGRLAQPASSGLNSSFSQDRGPISATRAATPAPPPYSAGRPPPSPQTPPRGRSPRAPASAR